MIITFTQPSVTNKLDFVNLNIFYLIVFKLSRNDCWFHALAYSLHFNVLISPTSLHHFPPWYAPGIFPEKLDLGFSK